MPHYKSPDDKIHFLDSPEFANILPPGSILINDVDVVAFLPMPTDNDAIKQQIASLEETITQRRLREATLTAVGKAWLKDTDSQITALRLTLTQ